MQPVENPVENRGGAVQNPTQAVATHANQRVSNYLKTLLCFQCGYQWRSRRDSAPARCPNCQSRKWFTVASPQVLATQTLPARRKDDHDVHHA